MPINIQDFVRGSGVCYWNNEAIGYSKNGILVKPDYKITPIFFEDTGLIPVKYIYSGCWPKIFVSIQSYNNLTKTLSLNTGNTAPGTLNTGKVLSESSKGSFKFIPTNNRNPTVDASGFASLLNSPVNFSYQALTEFSIVIMCESITFS